MIRLEAKVGLLCEATTWADFKAMRGDELEFPRLLRCLASDNEGAAVDAGGTLWDTICHQHSQLWSVALPTYPIFMLILRETKFEQVKIEIMDCLVGFVCGSVAYENEECWQGELWQLIKNDLCYFRSLDIGDVDNDVSGFAWTILDLMLDAR